MDFGIIILVAFISVFAICHTIKNARIQATSDDWFVVFDVDAEEKVLCLWFYPVLAFEVCDGRTLPITSRREYTTKLAESKPAKLVSDDFFGVTVTYGRWLRDGVMFDEDGNPDFRDRSYFSERIEDYLLGEFKLHLKTPIPHFYQAQLKCTVERANSHLWENGQV